MFIDLELLVGVQFGLDLVLVLLVRELDVHLGAVVWTVIDEDDLLGLGTRFGCELQLIVDPSWQVFWAGVLHILEVLIEVARTFYLFCGERYMTVSTVLDLQDYPFSSELSELGERGCGIIIPVGHSSSTFLNFIFIMKTQKWPALCRIRPMNTTAII